METVWGTGWFLRYAGKKDPTSLQDAVSCLKKLAQQLANATPSSQADAFSQTDAVSQSDAGNQTESSSKLQTDGHAAASQIDVKAQVAPCTPPSRHRNQRAVSRSRSRQKQVSGAASGSDATAGPNMQTDAGCSRHSNGGIWEKTSRGSTCPRQPERFRGECVG